MVLGERLVKAPHPGVWWITTHHSCQLGTDLTIFCVEVTSAHEVLAKSAKAPKLASMGVSPAVMVPITPQIEHLVLDKTTSVEVEEKKRIDVTRCSINGRGERRKHSTDRFV
jgi:hypothetical protein